MKLCEKRTSSGEEMPSFSSLLEPHIVRESITIVRHCPRKENGKWRARSCGRSGFILKENDPYDPANCVVQRQRYALLKIQPWSGFHHLHPIHCLFDGYIIGLPRSHSPVDGWNRFWAGGDPRRYPQVMDVPVSVTVVSVSATARSHKPLLCSSCSKQ